MAHIILIEPDRILAGIYLQSLAGAGHQVVACAGAQSAILAADQVQPDMVIMELQLIEHSGIEFMYEFRSYTEWQNIPVIIQTSIPPSEFNHSRKLLKTELTITDYLYKPQASLRQLLETVEKNLPVLASAAVT